MSDKFLESLATEIAFLNTEDLNLLGEYLVKQYPTRADILETGIGRTFQELETA